MQGCQCSHFGPRRQMFDRQVKEDIFIHCEWPSLNRCGGLRHQLSTTDSLESPTHFASGDLNRLNDGVWQGLAVVYPLTPPPVMVMTCSFFHTLAHVMTNMLNSGSTTFRTTSKLDGPDYLNTWDPPPFIFRNEEASWMRRRNGFTNPKKAPCLSLSSPQDCHDLDDREPTQTWGQKNVDLVIRQWAQLSVWTFEHISVFCNCADLSAESLHYTGPTAAGMTTWSPGLQLSVSSCTKQSTVKALGHFEIGEKKKSSSK